MRYKFCENINNKIRRTVSRLCGVFLKMNGLFCLVSHFNHDIALHKPDIFDPCFSISVSSVLVNFIFFALVGSIGTLAHYAVLYSLVEWQSLSPVAASGCGSIAGLLVNYALNFKFTFASRQSHARTFPKFAAIALLGMMLNLAFMGWLTQNLYYLYAQLLSTLLVLIWNFLANTFWTFKMDKTADASSVRLRELLKKPFSVLGLGLAIALIRLLSSGLYPLYDPSESRYAEMARKMLETGNWVTPMIDYGVPFWGKPPLTIWLTAGSLGMFGINDFAARLPSWLLGIGSALLLFHVLKVQRGVRSAWAVVLILVSSVLFFVMSGTVAMDQCMSFGVTLALSGFWLALRKEKSWWAYGFFLGLSIGLMAKGPITLVLTGTCIFFWTLLTGNWLLIWRRIPWIRGTLLMLCICAPWYVLAEQSTPGFLEYFFIGEHWKRFTESGWKGDLYGVGRAQPRGMIWVYWLLAGFPWTLVFLKKLFTAARRKQIGQLFRDQDGWQLYCLLWMLAPLLFFSFSANIIWTYVLPGLPGLALLLAGWPTASPAAKPQSALVLAVPGVFLALVAYYQLGEADFFRSQKRLVDAYRQVAAPDERLIYLKEKVYSAQFYLHGKAIELTDIPALQSTLDGGGHDYYVLRNVIAAELPETIKNRLQPVTAYGGFMLYRAVGLP